ncbi:MAG: methyltransferase domain-containing protein [Micromonosporaceae bacterium]|nr:methyltransferase domain-containing protein [Micromonosporaceae bacterium]
MSDPAAGRNLRRVWRYYDRTESRIGYQLLLGGTKHFGWYERGQSMWRFGAAMRRMERVLAGRLAVGPGARVLDAGCGMGAVARSLARDPGLDVIGIDILDFNLATARRRSAAAGLADRTRFGQADYHRLPFVSGSFDAVYTMETLVHAADPEAVLGEFWRVLKPGGRLVLFEYSRTPAEQVPEASNRAIELVCDLAAMPAWLRLYHGELEKLLAKAGFAVESATDVTERMLPMLRAFYLLGRLPYLVGRWSGRTAKVVNSLSGVETYRHRDAWRYLVYTATKP